jgi:hypothetical protein
MTLFRQTPFLLEFKDLIIARVKATNLIGTGPYSDLNTNGVKIMTEPEAPLNAPVIISYDEYSIQLTIDQLTGDSQGGSSILYYEISWDNGTGGMLWTPYTSMPFDNNFTTVTGLTSGTTYQFMYRA